MSSESISARSGNRPEVAGGLDRFGTLAAQLAAVAYLAWVIEADPGAVGVLLLAFVGVPTLGVFLLRRLASEGSAKSGVFASQAASSEAAFADSFDSLPSVHQRIAFWVHLIPIAVAPVGLAAGAGAGWPRSPEIASIALLSVLLATAASTLAFYGTRQRLLASSATIGLVREAVESAATAPRGVGRSGAERLQLMLGISVLAGLLVMVDAASHTARHQFETKALDWVTLAARRIALGDGSLSLPERVDQQLPATGFWPFAIDTFEVPLDDEAGDVLDQLPTAFVGVLEALFESRQASGPIAPSRGDALGAFARSPEGTLIVVKVDRAELPSGFGSTPGVLFATAFGLFFLVMMLVRLIRSEFTTGLDRLERQAAWLERRDLRESPQYPVLISSSDAFGRVSASLCRVELSTRAALERASGAAERVDQTVASLGEVLNEIMRAGAEQGRQVDAAHEMVASLQERVGQASRSANDLTHSIDESSHAVLELSAAGEELSETSSVLTEKVDAVSSSLEQMIASVNQVDATTGRLAEASEETSASMEEMASAMRAVDTSAETTASLSRDVVAKAELGQAKVVQTIEGMEAIRDATDVAESVIRGLGARTSEIGGILDVIEDVADETNLLALNAAIIAAQAGEHGKAFSVVADEIKELADRVLASTKEIGGLIRSVQEESENAIGAIEAGSASVMSGVDLSAEAGRTLEEITEASRESGTRIGEIVTSVREQTKAASHVVLLMERVRESADQIGQASAEHGRGNEIVYRSTLTMREVVEQVRRTTENQSAGFGRIRENVVGARGVVERISGSLRDQSDACAQVSGVLERVAEGGRTRDALAGRVQEAMRVLTAQAVELREDVERPRGLNR